MGPDTSPQSVRFNTTFLPQPHHAFKWSLTLMNIMGLGYLILFLGFGKQLHLSTLTTLDYISMNFLFPIGLGMLIGGAIIWAIIVNPRDYLDSQITYPKLGWLLGFFGGTTILSLLHDHHVLSLAFVESQPWFWVRIISLVAYATYMIYFSCFHTQKEQKPAFNMVHSKT